MPPLGGQRARDALTAHQLGRQGLERGGAHDGRHVPSGGRQGGSSFVSGKIDEVETFVATTSVIGQGRVPDARGRLVFHL